VTAWDPVRALADERTRTRERLDDLVADHAGIVEASADSNADDEHDPEGSTIAFERSQVGALVEQARAHLAEVNAALTRVEEGTYGVCASCDGPIAPARLEARPVARTCITCASRA
jgi:RNA polymerase-binding transcription factor DksA